jgi:F0F1-type ATP synthase assembly protein I
MSFVLALVMGFGGGYWLDGWLGTRPWLSFLGFFLGLGAGVLNVYRVLQATSQTGSTGASGRGPGTPPG